jgi:KDO2-lipid IV(A) lauroyltransferase
LARLLHVIEYAAARILVAVVLSLGFERTVRITEILADLHYRLDRKHRERALRNLRKAMPELSEAERERIARESVRSFIRTFAEVAWMPRLVRPGRFPAGVAFDVHPETRRILDAGESAIFFTGHMGNWEFGGQMMAIAGWPLVVVARPLDNPLLDRYVLGLRQRLGERVVSKHGAVRELVAALREKSLLAVVVDQNTGRHGVFVEYFGRPASTTPVPATLALRFGVPMLPGWCERTPGGFVLRIDAPLDYTPTGDRDRDVVALTQLMTRRVEAWVRYKPEQWLWMHRRWKTKPKSEEEWRLSPST